MVTDKYLIITLFFSDFGIVLGCRLFIKELSSKAREQLALSGQILQEGDIITRLHNTSCGDTMGLKEARKIMEGCKERLSLVVTRNNSTNSLSNGTALCKKYALQE